MEAIHLILDNCRPDDRNPCILAFKSPRASPKPQERALSARWPCSWRAGLFARLPLSHVAAGLSVTLQTGQRGELRFAR